ncbi:MAG: PIN domain nuclease [Planctomycetota bacterium]
MILVDTSVWVEYLRDRDRESPVADWLDRAILQGETPCTCGVVLTEVLQGVRGQAEHRRVKRTLDRLPYVAASREAYVLAADLYRAARKRGKTIRNTVDCIIAACAIVNDVALAQRDRDFETIAEVSDLRLIDMPSVT